MIEVTNLRDQTRSFFPNWLFIYSIFYKKEKAKPKTTQATEKPPMFQQARFSTQAGFVSEAKSFHGYRNFAVRTRSQTNLFLQEID